MTKVMTKVSTLVMTMLFHFYILVKHTTHDKQLNLSFIMYLYVFGKRHFTLSLISSDLVMYLMPDYLFIHWKLYGTKKDD